MAPEPGIGGRDDGVRIGTFVEDQDGMHLDVAAGALEADDGRVSHTAVGDQHLLDVVGVHLGAVGR